MFEVETIQLLHTDEFWIYTGVSIAAALAGLYFGLRKLRLARLIENTPTSKIRSAHQGYVELIGTCRLPIGGAVISPLSQTPCAWYHYRVEKQGKKDWRTVRSGNSPKPFILDDGTGLCAVYPKGAAMSAGVSNSWRGNATPGMVPGIGTSGDLRYTETLLFENDPLYLIGYFRTLDRAVNDYRAENPVLAPEPPDTGEEAHPQIFNVMADTGTDRLPYIISSRGQEKLSRSKKNWGRAGLAMFFIAGAIAVRLLSARFF